MSNQQMKATRSLDELGRIVLPQELRKQIGWEERDCIEIMVSEDSKIVTLKKTNGVVKCALCGCLDEGTLVPVKKGLYLCKECITIVRNTPELQ